MNYCVDCQYVLPPSVETSFALLCTYYLHQVTAEPIACQLIRPNGIYDENQNYPECKAYKASGKRLGI